MLKLIRAKTTTFTSDTGIVVVGSREIEMVKKAASKDPFGRARICLHFSEKDKVQEMIIAMKPDTYVRPHCHKGKSESYHIIEGSMTLVLFDNAGSVTDHIELSLRPGAQFTYRVPAEVWHTVLVRTPVVFHETSTGPFRKHGSEFAAWSPGETDTVQVSEYLNKLRRISG